MVNYFKRYLLISYNRKIRWDLEAIVQEGLCVYVLWGVCCIHMSVQMYTHV